MRVELPHSPPCPEGVPIHSINHLKVMTLMMLIMVHFESVNYSIRLQFEQLAKMVKQPIMNMEIDLFSQSTMN